MKSLAVILCASACFFAQVTYAQTVGWVLWIGLGDRAGVSSWLIADAFDAFGGCERSLDPQTAVFLQNYPKEMFDVKLSARNAVRTIDATQILSDEQARKKREEFAKNQFFRSYSEEALEKMSRQGDTRTTQIICLPGGTVPPTRVKP